MFKNLFIGIAILYASCSHSFAAGWSFSTSPPFIPGNDEGISAICWYGSTLYAGINGISGGQPYGRIAKYLSGTWTDITNSYTTGNIYAMSVASINFNIELFVGGDFTGVGPTGLTVNNVAKFTLSSPPVWSALNGASGSKGTDGPVWALYALENYYSSFGVTYRDPLVYVGGNFTTAGTVGSPSIARWKGGSTWESVGGGVSGSVFGVSVFHSSDQSGYTVVNSVFLAGFFNKMISSTTTYNAAKYTGSWTYIGEGIGNVDSASPTPPCSYSFNGPHVYLTEAVANDGNTAYFGGYFEGIRDKNNGAVQFNPINNFPSCDLPGTSGVAQLSSANLLTLPDKTDMTGGGSGGVISAAVKSSILYVGGSMLDISGNPVYASKLVSGNWNHLTGAGAPAAPIISTVSGSSYIYFATSSTVYAYSP